MSTEATRKAQIRARLQSRFRSQQTTDPSTLSLKDLETLCEKDASTLCDHILTVTRFGVPISSPRWSELLDCLEEGVRRIEEAGLNTRRLNTTHDLRMHNNRDTKMQAIAQARTVLDRLGPLIARLPPDHRVQDARRLGFRCLNSVQEATAHAGDGDDPAGNYGFLAARRDFEQLGIPLPLMIGPRQGSPLTSDDWAKVLDSMEESLNEYWLYKQAEQIGAKHGVKRMTRATVRRLQAWIKDARAKFASQGGGERMLVGQAIAGGWE